MMYLSNIIDYCTIYLYDFMTDFYQIIEKGNAYLSVRRNRGRQLVWEEYLKVVPVGDKLINYKTATVYETLNGNTDSRTVCIMWFTTDNGIELSEADVDFIEQNLDIDIPEVKLIYPDNILSDYKYKFLVNTLSSIYSPNLNQVKINPVELSQVFPELNYVAPFDKITIYNEDTFDLITYE